MRAVITFVASVAAGIMGLIAALPAYAQSERCAPITDLFDKELPAFGGANWGAHQLRKNGEVWYIIFSQNNQQGSKWVVSARHSEKRPDIYCILGQGDLAEPLASLHQSKFQERFGMPGSGYPRCGNKEDPIGSLAVRAWANRELGNSLVLSLDGTQETSFVLLVSQEGNFWTLLDQKRGQPTCYLDRGEGGDFRQIVLTPRR